MKTLTITDGRSIKTTSNKRYHLVMEDAQTGKLYRYTSSVYQGKIIAVMAGLDAPGRMWLVDTQPGARNL